jgi:hypothetical protein
MPSTLTDRLNGMTTSVAVKPPCAAVANAPLTLAGEQTVNGVAITTGMRVLADLQPDPVDNGIYIADTGVWSRAPDFDGALDAVDGTLVLVHAASGPDQLYELSATNPVIIGTSALTFSLSSLTTTAFGASLLAAANAAAARVLLGFSTYFSTLIVAADAAAMRVLLGFSTFVSGLVGAADAAAFRTAIGAQVSGSYAASGANADITSLTALTYPYLDITGNVTLSSTSYGKSNRFTAVATATLPALSGVPAGTRLSFTSQTADGTANSVIRNGSDTILFGGTAINTVPMRSKGDSMMLLADPANTQWVVIAENIKTNFRAYKSAASQNLTTGVPATIVYDAKTADTTNSFTSNAFPCPFTGSYTFSTENLFNAVVDAAQGRTSFLKNGTDFVFSYKVFSGTAAQGIGFAATFDCVAGDVITVTGLQQMGVTATINNNALDTWFSGSRNH